MALIDGIPNLRDHIEFERCIAFVGSGPSVPIYGTWLELTRHLCHGCGISVELNGESSAETLQSAAQSAREANPGVYFQLLGDHFGKVTQTNPNYDLLMRIPFKSYVTLNFDPLLAQESQKPEHRCCGVMTYPDLDRANIGRRAVYYAHGLIREGEYPNEDSLVLCKSDFDRAYADNGWLLTFLIPTLAKEQVCFVGCRLKEPEFQRLFEICKERQEEIRRTAGGTPPTRIILLEELVLWSKDVTGQTVRNEYEERRREAEEDEFFRGLDIKVVRYPRLDENHVGLRRTLQTAASFPTMRLIAGFDAENLP
ncbi:MAG: SIR2 family protein [Planctomycetia bacterium]|nr:SIR2 family protein [Planctomycetia bacterium]